METRQKEPKQAVYDAVGNRLTQDKTVGGQHTTTTYIYDAANRLQSVNGVTYTWDNNGNLLNDGVNTYTYDAANRLITLNGGPSAFSYNGLGNRLQQTISGQTTRYALDINTSLPNVLSDGSRTYTYGLGNVSQGSGTATDYFLGDALGSTRQLTGATGQIGLAESYDPFGNPAGSAGTASSIFAYAGQQTDPSGMQFLRARYYQPTQGRFLNRDTFAGYADLPQSLNQYVYGLDNPVRYTDPSGNFPFINVNDFTNAFNAAMNWAAGGGNSPCGPSWDQLIMRGGAESVAWMINSTTSILGWVGSSYQLGWTNFGSALAVLGNPNAPVLYKAYAGIYAFAWGGFNAALAVGTAIVGYSVASAAIATVAPSLAVLPTLFPAVQSAGNVLAVGGEGYLLYRAVLLNDQDAQLALITGYDITKQSALINGLSSLWKSATVTPALSETDIQVPQEIAPAGVVSNQAEAPCSFSAETEVATKDGQKPIDEIKIGDLVLAYNQDAKSTGYYPVKAALRHEDTTIIHLTLDDDKITTTLEHPFFTKENGWTEAGNLKQGMHVQKADGTYGAVKALTVERTSLEMYNLTVGTAHTFFVGEGRWLVHNACPNLPIWRGGKAQGILDTGSGQIHLESGYNGPSASMPEDTPGMSSDLAVRSHVEAHASAIMRQQDLSQATLYINRVPCPGPLGCNNLLPHMLPESATLRVYVLDANGTWTYYNSYTGLPDSLWSTVGR